MASIFLQAMYVTMSSKTLPILSMLGYLIFLIFVEETHSETLSSLFGRIRVCIVLYSVC